MGRGTSNVLYGPTLPRGTGEAGVAEITTSNKLSPVILEVTRFDDLVELDVAPILSKISDPGIEELYGGDWGSDSYRHLLDEATKAGITDPQSKPGDLTAQDLMEKEGESQMVLDGVHLTNYIREHRPKLAIDLELTPWS